MRLFFNLRTKQGAISFKVTALYIAELGRSNDGKLMTVKRYDMVAIDDKNRRF